MKRGLGKGLDKLLGAPQKAEQSRAASKGADNAAVTAKSEPQSMAVSALSPGMAQPRQYFDKDELQAMAESIRTQGIIQPIIIRKTTKGNYEIIAGERRWRAAQIANLKTVPVAVRQIDDRQAMLFALAENIQRADLQPIEQARGIQRLLDKQPMTHAAAAEALGLSRPALTNLLRLLQLSPPVLKLLERGELEAGHARAMLPLLPALQSAAARRAVAEKMSTRQVEKMVRDMLAETDEGNGKKHKAVNADSTYLAKQLSERLSARVEINHRANGSGRLTIHYGSLESLDRISNKLKK